MSNPKQGSQLPIKLVRSNQEVDPAIVVAQPTLLGAIKLCVQLAGFVNDKDAGRALGIDQGHWSRIMCGKGHLPTDAFNELMDVCGNEAPLMWLVHSRGYDLHSLRKRESETEREKRELQEQLDELRRENEIMRGLIRK